MPPIKQPTEIEDAILHFVENRARPISKNDVVSALGTRKGFEKVKIILSRLVERKRIILDEKGNLSVQVAA
jgi:hypothetical protein